MAVGKGRSELDENAILELVKKESMMSNVKEQKKREKERRRVAVLEKTHFEIMDDIENDRITLYGCFSATALGPKLLLYLDKNIHNLLDHTETASYLRTTAVNGMMLESNVMSAAIRT